MENIDNEILFDQTFGKEYQIPELVVLNGIDEAMGTPVGCISGSSNGTNCALGNMF